MPRNYVLSKAINILERIASCDIPLEIDFKDFNNKMNILLSKQSRWLDIWQELSINLGELFNKFKNSRNYRNLQNQIMIIQIFVISLFAISIIFTIINPITFIAIPVILFIFLMFWFLKRIIIKRKIILPNLEFIKRKIKQQKGLLELIKFLRAQNKNG